MLGVVSSGKDSQIFIANGLRWTLLERTIPRWVGSPVKLVVVENLFKAQNHRIGWKIPPRSSSPTFD